VLNAPALSLSLRYIFFADPERIYLGIPIIGTSGSELLLVGAWSCRPNLQRRGPEPPDRQAPTGCQY